MQNDLTIYTKFANEWWEPSSPRFRTLQNLTPLRLSLIEELVGDLKNREVLDLGCGGGLISVPLLKMGAKVTGVDQCPASIEIVQSITNLKDSFFVGDATQLVFQPESFDVVLLADVLDHIPNYAKVLEEVSRVLKPNGLLFVGTINRNPIAHFLTVTVAENLGYIPKGTHDPKLFIKPKELIAEAERCGFHCLKIQGEWPEFFQTIKRKAITLRRSSTKMVAYSAVFKKI
jgi:2-polyprenyl-6-hydroxyphenyl methylase / 3-demethylubiquinone-9 3-methyltransferase